MHDSYIDVAALGAIRCPPKNLFRRESYPSHHPFGTTLLPRCAENLLNFCNKLLLPQIAEDIKWRQTWERLQICRTLIPFEIVCFCDVREKVAVLH